MAGISSHDTVIRLLGGENVEVFPSQDAERVSDSFRTVATRFQFTSNDVSILADLLDKLQSSADPIMALNNLQRYAESTGDPADIRIAFKRSPESILALVTLFAGSQFLSDVLIAQPHNAGWLISHETLRGQRSPEYYRQGINEVIQGLPDPSQGRGAIIWWRRKEYLRIGLRDLMRIADAEETSRDISDLAETIIDMSATIVFDELAKRFGLPIPEASSWETPVGEASGITDTEMASGMCVLGMGKLGGRELNFASDIDLIFIYEAEGETTGRLDGERRVAVISNHDFFTRMGEKLVKFLGERSVDGNLFRVDMRLRPEGGDGPLTRSLESFIYYLNTQARDWERLAYLKARVLSGPARLTEKLYRVISEFVYSGTDAQRIVSEVQELKIRIDREVLNSDLYHREVKRGYGGIREIEFVLSAMQIIHGYNHRALRVRNAFLAIQRLRETHIISTEDATFYQYAYSFLRMVEHRLQMAHEAQTHTLPLRGSEYETVARRCGFTCGDDFEQEYQRITNEVHARFTAFFEHDTDALEQAARDIIVILDKTAPREEALAALYRRGVHQPDALRLIHALAYGTREVFVSAEGQRSFEQLLPSLLRLTAVAPFPEKVLSHLHSFALAIKGITYYYEVIAHHPEILKLLVTLFGTSDSLGAQLIAYPEFFDSLISTRVLNDPDPDGIARRERMNAVFSVRTSARRQVILRRVVHYERLILALQYLLRLRPLEDCLYGLGNTADIALEIGLRLAAGQLLARWQDRPTIADDEINAFMRQVNESFAVVAMGKYGGNELNFYGDLDVVFVYDESVPLPEECAGRYSSAQEFHDVLADNLMLVMTEQLKGGKVFEVDARLRPYGKGAPITTERNAYSEYLSAKFETWELQAFQRARCVLGNPELLKDLHDVARSTALSKDKPSLRADVVAMRKRLEESVEASAVSQLEIKRSPGGLVDVEFLLQYFVLTGDLSWNSDVGSYFQLLQNLPDRIISAEESRQLLSAYRVLREVENTSRLISGSGDSSFIYGSPAATGCAVALGYKTEDKLLDAVRQAMETIRRIYDNYLG